MSNRADRIFRCIGLFWLLFVLVLVLRPTGRYSYSIQVFVLYRSVLVNALGGVPFCCVGQPRCCDRRRAIEYEYEGIL